MATTEVALAWGGDFVLDSTGDLVLLQDGNGAYPALTQRLTQMVLTTPLITASNGTPLSVPDDVFHPTAGAGLRWAVGRLGDNGLLDQIELAVLEELAKEPDVAPQPKPTVSFVVYQNGASCQIVFTAITGQVVALPPIPITPSGV